MASSEELVLAPGPRSDEMEHIPLHTRMVRGIITFSRRKPLGAFGALLVLIPLFASFFLPGLDLGIIETPRILKYGGEDYQLGQKLLEGPSWEHPMGTDWRGRDLFARLMDATRMSFMLGGAIFFISTIISTTITVVSSYYINSIDLIMQRVVEIVGFLPDLVLLIALFSIYGATPLTFILTLGILGGFNTSRILRSLVIQVRSMPYIEAAKTLGASDRRIILRHILPQIAFLIIVFVTGGLALALLVEAGLALLGFGLPPNIPTLGNLLNGSREFLRVAPHLAIFPSLILFMILLGSRLLGDALRDVLDPRLRGSR